MKSEPAHWSDPVTYLRAALAGNQFTLYCQPIAALTGAVAYPMAEVLIRLREEETALLPPGEFLPILEHYGMMPELDRWVVRQVLRRFAAGSDMPCFTVNLSGQTIADPTFPEFFANEILVTGAPADCVLFEIDETDALALPDSVSRFSATIGSLGSGMAIDGFGRAQNYLASFKVPCLKSIKLDGSLTRNLARGGLVGEKLNAIVRVASAVGVHLIAECVDDPDLLPRLRAMKIRYAQGFGVCVPLSIDAISRLPLMRSNERNVEGPDVSPTGVEKLTGNVTLRWTDIGTLQVTSLSC